MGLGDRLEQAKIRKEEQKAADEGRMSKKQAEVNADWQKKIAENDAKHNGSSAESK